MSPDSPIGDNGRTFNPLSTAYLVPLAEDHGYYPSLARENSPQILLLLVPFATFIC